MNIHLYLTLAIVSFISTLIIFFIIGFTTRNIIRGSRLRMFITLLLSVTISVIATTLLSRYFGESITNAIQFINYNLIEVIIAGLLTTIFFGFFFKDYLLDKKYFFTGLIVFSSYILLNYRGIPIVFEFINKLF